MKPKHSRNLSILGAIVFTATAAHGAPITQTASDALGFTSFNTAGVTQVETATAAGTITTAGSLAVTVTSANVTGSPVTVNVPVALGDTAATWSPKVVTALNANAAIAAQFTAGGTAPAITLTGKVASPTIPATDATLNIAIANGTAAGITPVTTSANTRGVTYTWSDSLAPKSGNTYSTNGLALRTPPTSDSAFTFGGDSLTVETKSSASGAGSTMLLKNTGNQTLTFTNLIMNGGIIGHGQGGVTTTLAGAIAANATSAFSISDANDGRAITITAPITGAGRLYVGSFNSYSASGYTPTAWINTFTVSGNNSGFSGGWSLGGSYDATFFGGSTTYTAKFAASLTTFRVNNANALGTGTLELKEGILNLNGFSPSGLAGVTFPTGSTATIRSAANTLTSTNLNFGTTAGSAAVIDLLSTGTPAIAPLNSTTLTINGPSTMSIKGLAYAVGSFPLISYSGSIGGPLGFSDLSLLLPSGVSGSLTNTPGSLISANITAVESLRWTNGAATGAWNTTALNWKNPANTDVAYQENVIGGYSVLFNESEPEAGPAIAVPATVSPNTIAINNPAKNYSFSGSAINCSGNITKDGAGTATFANTVTSGGSTSINAGRVEFTGTGTLTNGPLSIASGAYLSYNSASNYTHAATSSTGMTLTGAGTIQKKGAGTVTFANGTGQVKWNLDAGALIDVQGGKLVGGSNNNDIWTNNKASLNIAAGATFEAVEADVTVDSLTGSGIYQCGFFGPRNLKVGVNGGSGTFSGTLQTNGSGGVSSSGPILIKAGAGTQTLTGTLNFYNYYTGTCLQVNGGTLEISPTGPSVIGSTGSDVFVAPGQTDVGTLNQTAGTITTRNLSIGQQGAGTFSISGGTVNGAKIDLASTGPTTGSGPAAMNVSGTAQVNLNNNGGILMGQFYGRPVTVTQTGGNVVCFSDAGITRGGTGGGLRFLSGNTSSAYNLNGGTLSIPAITWSPATAGYGGGNGTINFNGGILQITNAAFAVPTGLSTNLQPKIAGKVLGDELTPNSGARIDNYGLAVTFAAPILHGPTGVFDGGLKVETSVPGGSLTLSGINTYTGNTTVPTGNSFILADNAGLTFVLNGTLNNKVTGAGTVSFSGDFTIDTTSADITNGNIWTLVDAAIPPGAFTSSFTLVGFTETGTSGIHTKTDGLNTWTFNESTGQLSLAVSTLSGYALWISGYSVGGLNLPTDDAESDGTENLLEYVLNGNPTMSDPSILPALDDSGANFVFSFTRLEESINDTTQTFQYGSDLTGWTTVNITAPTGPEVSLGALGVPSAGLRTVTVTIPKSAAVGGKLFGRLMATKP